MSVENSSFHLPPYQSFIDTLAVLDLPISVSELHGQMCGYLCAGATLEGEAYLRALLNNHKNEPGRAAALAIFAVYAISQEQMRDFDFKFELMLPEDHEPLINRARAFSEWCEGFTQGLSLSGIRQEQLEEEEAQEALEHLVEFAQLDYQSLDVDEEDEKALVEVSEYARMAVLRLYGDLLANDEGRSSSTAH